MKLSLPGGTRAMVTITRLMPVRSAGRCSATSEIRVEWVSDHDGLGRIQLTRAHKMPGRVTHDSIPSSGVTCRDAAPPPDCGPSTPARRT
jgi:hypothetical protein